jgi:tetratricopeptide (TPR) repeat protein
MRTLNQSVLLAEAHRALDAGDLAKATSLCQRLLKQNSADMKAMRLAGMLAYARGDHQGALDQFRKCLRKTPNAWVIHHDIGQIHMQYGRYDEAITSFNKALKAKPNYGQAIAGKADVLERQGDAPGALAILQPFLTNGTEDAYIATAALKLLDQSKQTQAAIDLARKHADRRDLDVTQRRLMHQQLGRLYDKIGDYPKAFEAFRQGNQSDRSFQVESFVESVDTLLEVFSRENLKRFPRSTLDSEVPVFIACMPRSGSTLVDQIVHSHPQAFGAGELATLIDMISRLHERLETFETYPQCLPHITTSVLDEIGQSYLKEIQKLDPSSIRITNKHLQNYMHLGVLSMIFPKARIIHIHRDPLDNCLGMYMAALDVNRYPWVSDFRHLGLVYRQYQRIMAHWRGVLEIPMLDVKYENLVEDPDGWIRQIIEFCGLSWDDKCLRYYEADRAVLTLSYDQVRRPIFKTAVNRAQRYAAFLEPLKQALIGDAAIG